MWTHNRRVCLILTLHTETRFENMAPLCSQSPWQRHVRTPHHSVALHIELCGPVISVSFCFTWQIIVYFTFPPCHWMGGSPRDVFLLHNTGESTNIFLLLFFLGRKIDCDFEGRMIDSTNLKILVGRCRDRPSSALLLLCPKGKLLNQRRKKRKQQKKERERKKTKKKSKNEKMNKLSIKKHKLKMIKKSKERKKKENEASKGYPHLRPRRLKTFDFSWEMLEDIVQQGRSTKWKTREKWTPGL